MKKLKKLERKLFRIYCEWADSLSSKGYSVLSDEIIKERKKRAKEIEEEIDNLYIHELEELKNDHPEVLKNGEVEKLFDVNAKSNCLIFKFLIKHPEIYTSTYITSEVGKFIYDWGKNGKKRIVSPVSVEKKINVLDKIQPAFYHYTNFIEFLNNYYFEYLYAYFQNETMMDNPRFIQFLLSIVQNPEKNIRGTEEYHQVDYFALSALAENLDIEFVYALGNKKKYNNYLSCRYKEEVFSLINSIHDTELKKKLLIDIFGLKKLEYLPILMKFFAIPEVQEQLLDPSSFYYQLLIKPLTTKEEDSTNCENNTEPLNDFDYASIGEVIRFHSDDFNNGELDKMIHHFDKHVGNYIYFYYENEVKRVPVLYYIQTMRQKTEMWKKLNLLTSSHNTSLNTCETLFELFAYYTDNTFQDFARDSLVENIGKCMTSEEEDYWTHLLSEADYLADIEDEKLLELKNTI